MATIPKDTDSSDTFIKAADERLGEIRKLGAKPETRYFGIGPKKSLSTQDKLRQGVLSQNELSFRSTGMRKRRLESGSTRMSGGKELKN
jgi:hypothetical protein